VTQVGRSPRNHPSQVALRGPDFDVDDRRTPQDVWLALHREHRFTIDVAASVENAKLPVFFDRERDGLSQSWRGEVAWCNPPYSDCGAWVEYAIEQVRAGCLKVVILLPANRTEQAWWQDLIEPVRDRGLGMSTRFLPGRMRFGCARRTSADAVAPNENRPPFGNVLVIVQPPPRARLRRLAREPRPGGA
jgi:phage N-6-adenine-methyltransferase